MSAPVHILASCRNVNLIDATLMVFRTLRVGFPKAEVLVHVNAMHPSARRAVLAAAEATDCGVVPSHPNYSIPHDQWVEKLFNESHKPYFICDTDIAFFGSCEAWNLQGNFAGRLVPAFDEEWTQTIHEERLHTCLQWFDPAKARMALWEYSCRYPESWMAPRLDFFRQSYWPSKGSRTRFHDTTAGLWHTIGGVPFTPEQNACFEHLDCGTYSDLVGPALKGRPGFEEAHRYLTQHPESAKGIQQDQARYYAERAI